MFFCETWPPLDSSAHLYNPFLLVFLTNVLGISGLDLSLSWGSERLASFDGLGFFVALVGDDCFTVDGTSVSDWVHITQRIVGRYLQGKEKGVDFCLKYGQKTKGTA